jgi:hypothetical protein
MNIRRGQFFSKKGGGVRNKQKIVDAKVIRNTKISELEILSNF